MSKVFDEESEKTIRNMKKSVEVDGIKANHGKDATAEEASAYLKCKLMSPSVAAVVGTVNNSEELLNTIGVDPRGKMRVKVDGEIADIHPLV